MPFTVGQNVQCRESDVEQWQNGRVMEVLADGRPKVLVEGHSSACILKQVREVPDSWAREAVQDVVRKLCKPDEQLDRELKVLLQQRTQTWDMHDGVKRSYRNAALFVFDTWPRKVKEKMKPTPTLQAAAAFGRARESTGAHHACLLQLLHVTATNYGLECNTADDTDSRTLRATAVVIAVDCLVDGMLRDAPEVPPQHLNLEAQINGQRKDLFCRCMGVLEQQAAQRNLPDSVWPALHSFGKQLDAAAPLEKKGKTLLRAVGDMCMGYHRNRMLVDAIPCGSTGARIVRILAELHTCMSGGDKLTWGYLIQRFPERQIDLLLNCVVTRYGSRYSPEPITRDFFRGLFRQAVGGLTVDGVCALLEQHSAHCEGLFTSDDGYLATRTTEACFRASLQVTHADFLRFCKHVSKMFPAGVKELPVKLRMQALLKEEDYAQIDALGDAGEDRRTAQFIRTAAASYVRQIRLTRENVRVLGRVLARLQGPDCDLKSYVREKYDPRSPELAVAVMGYILEREQMLDRTQAATMLWDAATVRAQSCDDEPPLALLAIVAQDTALSWSARAAAHVRAQLTIFFADWEPSTLYPGWRRMHAADFLENHARILPQDKREGSALYTLVWELLAERMVISGTASEGRKCSGEPAPHVPTTERPVFDSVNSIDKWLLSRSVQVADMMLAEGTQAWAASTLLLSYLRLTGIPLYHPRAIGVHDRENDMTRLFSIHEPLLPDWEQFKEDCKSAVEALRSYICDGLITANQVNKLHEHDAALAQEIGLDFKRFRKDFEEARNKIRQLTVIMKSLEHRWKVVGSKERRLRLEECEADVDNEYLCELLSLVKETEELLPRDYESLERVANSCLFIVHYEGQRAAATAKQKNAEVNLATFKQLLDRVLGQRGTLRGLSPDTPIQHALVTLPSAETGDEYDGLVPPEQRASEKQFLVSEDVRCDPGVADLLLDYAVPLVALVHHLRHFREWADTREPSYLRLHGDFFDDDGGVFLLQMEDIQYVSLKDAPGMLTQLREATAHCPPQALRLIGTVLRYPRVLEFVLQHPETLAPFVNQLLQPQVEFQEYTFILTCIMPFVTSSGRFNPADFTDIKGLELMQRCTCTTFFQQLRALPLDGETGLSAVVQSISTTSNQSVLDRLSRSASAGALPRGLDSHALAGSPAPALRRVQSSDTLESLPPTVPVRLEPVAPRPGTRSASRTAWDEAAPEDSEPRFPEVLEVIVKNSFQGYTGRYVRTTHTRNGAPVWQQQGSDKVLDFSKLQGDTHKRWTLGSPMGCHIKSEQMPSPTCGPQAARGWVACKSLQEAAVQVHVFDPLQEFDQGLPLCVAPVLPREPSLEDILTTKALSWAERRSAPTEVCPAAPDFRTEATLLQRAEGDARAMLRAREHRGWLVGVGAFSEVLTCSRTEEYERQSIRRGEASQRVHFTMTLRYHFLRGLEQRRRWAIASTCLVHSVQLEQALHFGQLWYNAAALIACWRATKSTLRHMLPGQLRSAALARARCIRVALPDRGAGYVSYQRSFTLHEDMPQWTCTKDGKRFAILFRTVKSNGFEMLDHKEHVLAGAAETCTMLDHGCVECNGPDGSRLMISIAPGQGEAETLPLYSQWAEPFRMVQNMPTQFQPIASGSEVDDARKAAWKRRVILDDAQEAARASGPQHRARAERDSARVAALAAQKHFVKALNAPEVEALLRDGKGALASLEKAFLDADSPAVARGDRPAATEAIGFAADQAKQLLDSFQRWQRKYEDAVKAAEAGTDAARAAAQRFTLDPENPTACPSLGRLAVLIREAAEAEAALRASPEGVTPAPREQMDAAVAAALVAIDGGLGVLLALDTERREAQSVLNELSEGCRAAEGGEFYARLQRMVAPDAESMLSPRQVSGGKGARQKYELLLTMRSSFEGAEAKWEAECAKLCREAEEEEARAVPLATLHEEADLLLARQKHAKTPADKAKNQQRLDAVLQQLRRLRKERMVEAAEVLRLASIHFPECTNELCRGTDEELRRMMLDKRPESLRLLVAGGSLTDYTICGPSLSRRQPVIPADSGHGRVVIKKTPLTEGALQTFGRGVVMMDAAGDAAAAVRCVFVDVHEDTPHGCVVMENYQFTLATWAAPERADALSPAAILRMVQLLLGCLVRLHSATPRLRDAELADGIIHGDISPANIVVDESGQPRFIDFEMARTGGVQPSTVFGPQGMTVEFAAPELLSRYGMRDPSVKATKMTDVYGMGATLKHVLEQPHVRRVAGRVCEHLLPLCERMQSRDPGARPTAAEAFAASDITEAIDQQFRRTQGELDEQHRKVTAERDRVLREQAAVQAEKQDVAELAKKLASRAATLKDKGEAEREANEREQERLRRREAELKDKGAKLAAEEKALSAEHKKVETQKRQIEKLKEAVHDPPKHWTDAPGLSQGWRAAPVADTTPVFLALKNSLLRTKKEWLGLGRDAGGGKYDKLVLQRAWRIENPTQWKQYSIAREAVADAVKHKRLGKKDLKLRQETADTLGPKGTALPDALRGGGVNEVRLFHGTRPDVLLSLLNDGLNERFSGTNAGALFGQGLYFAEDPGKSDHYVRPHAPGTAPDLERRLYRAGVTQPGTVFYVLVCRVVCGDFAITVDAETLTTGGTLWATPHKRELVRTPTGDHYTSLLAELGPQITRYREFILFRGQRAYPEYLLAYTRE